jgi:hypothetical protein
MIKALRDWLEAEMKLLANASHHAYSFGQANMAKRAIEELDRLTAGKVAIVLTEEEAAMAAAALEGSTDPRLIDLASQLKTAGAPY